MNGLQSLLSHPAVMRLGWTLVHFLWQGAAIAALSALMLATIPAEVSADVLVFTHAGRGDGTLDGVAFPMSDFVMRASADTSNRQSYTSGWFIDHTTASVEITGLGEFNILTGTRTFLRYGPGMVGFSRAGTGGADLFNGPKDAAFETWVMLTPIGPISGGGGILQWSSSPINTTEGVLIFNDRSADATFEAVPEPATLSLLALGGLAAIRRRRK